MAPHMLYGSGLQEREGTRLLVASMSNRDICLQLLDRALSSPYGLAVRSQDVEHLKRCLGTVRQEERKRGSPVPVLVLRKPGDPFVLLLIPRSIYVKVKARKGPSPPVA